MKPIIVTDSSCDLNDSLTQKMDIRRAPYAIQVNGHDYLDDDAIQLSALLRDIDLDPEAAKTAAVSPQSFLDAIGEAAEAFIVTISGKLSTSYNNARLAAEELLEAGRKVHVFDSQSAGAGETSFVAKVWQMLEAGLSFEEIVSREEEMQKNTHTFFILDDYSTLVKNGRLPKLAGKLLTGLSLHPVAYGSAGVIEISTIARGMSTAIRKMAASIAKMTVDFSMRTLYISYVENLDRAKEVAEAILSQVPFQKVEILEGSGLVSVYANAGGIVVGF